MVRVWLRSGLGLFYLFHHLKKFTDSPGNEVL